MPGAVSGQSGHNDTFQAACILVQGFGLSPEQAWPLMVEFNAKCSPQWSDKELRHKLSGADKAVSQKGRGWLAKGAEWVPSKNWQGYHSVPEIKKAVFESEKLKKFAGNWARTVDLVWLANRSAIDPATVTASRFLELLYEPSEKVCVFTNEHTARLGDGVELWPDVTPALAGPEPRPCGVWYLAQPVTGGYHPTDDGDKMSCRNHRAVTAWRYMVIESDSADTWQWLGALAQLPLRLAALYSSGGRSVHALVRVDAPTKEAWDAMRDGMRDILTILGGDRKTLTAVRLTRLPGCLRHGKMEEEIARDANGAELVGPDGKKVKVKRYRRFATPMLQKLLYINPRPDLAPLVEFFPRRDVVKQWCELAAVGVSSISEQGAEKIERALDYYAGRSVECRVALAEWRGEV